jgi:hypothetical protein
VIPSHAKVAYRVNYPKACAKARRRQDWTTRRT